MSEGLLLRVSGWRARHGPRREQFAAYRRFCARRARLLRRGARLPDTRRPSRELVVAPPPDCSPARLAALLEVAVLRVERRLVVQWEAQRRPGTATRRVLARRLHRAQTLSQATLAAFGPLLAPRAQLELRAYAASAEAALLMHCGRAAEAKAPLQLQLDAARALAEGSAAVERATLEEWVQSAAQSLRRCRFELGEFGEGAPPALRHAADLAELLRALPPAAPADGCAMLPWPRPERIDEPRLAAILARLSQCEEALAARADPQELLFWETLNVVEEAAQACRARAALEPGLASALALPLAFLARERELLCLRRQLRAPTDSCRALEAALGHTRALIELHNRYNDDVALLVLLEASLRAHKCVLLAGQFHARKRHLAALSLLAVARPLLETARGGDWAGAGRSATGLDARAQLAGEPSLVERGEQLRAQLPALADRLALVDKQARVALYDEQQQRMADVERGVATLSVTPTASGPALLDVLTENTATGAATLEWTRPRPLPGLVQAKPALGDPATELLAYPAELSARREKPGFFGRLFGFKG